MAIQANLEDTELIEMDTPLQFNGAIIPFTSIIAPLSYKDFSSADHAKLEDADLLDVDTSAPFSIARGPLAEPERTSNFRPGGKAEAMLNFKRNLNYPSPTTEPTPRKAELLRLLARTGSTTGLRDRRFMAGNPCRSQYDEEVDMYEEEDAEDSAALGEDEETPEEDDENEVGDEEEDVGEDEEDEGKENEEEQESQEEEDEDDDDDDDEQEEHSMSCIPAVMYAAPAKKRVGKGCPPTQTGASIFTRQEDQRGSSYRRVVTHDSGSKSPSSARGLKGTYPTAHVKAHPNENFWHGGRGWWHPGLPAEGAHPTTGVRGPGAAAWKARNTAQGRKNATS